MEERSPIEIEKYADIYEKNGYDLAGSASIFVPWFQCTLKCQCRSEAPMSELDDVVCRCVEREINTREDIAFVLALDMRIIAAEIEELVLAGILTEENGKFYLTESGASLHKKNAKTAKIKQEFPIFINAITGECALSDWDWLAQMDIPQNAVCLQPLQTVRRKEMEHKTELFTTLQTRYHTNIVSMELLDYQRIYYQKETILFYKNDAGQILFALYHDEKEELDISLAKVLTEKYQRRELLEIMQAETALRALDETFIKETARLSGIKRNYKYYRNKQIRELFKNIFDIAEKSVFLVSPWIDNNNYVMTEEVLSKIEQALKERGIRIVIGYGYISPEQMEQKREWYAKHPGYRVSFRDREWETELMARKLQERFGKYDNFSLVYVGTHEKILSYDEKYTLIGSYNLLSYDGGESRNYRGFSFRYEGGVMIEDAEFARDVREEIMKNINHTD